ATSVLIRLWTHELARSVGSPARLIRLIVVGARPLDDAVLVEELAEVPARQPRVLSGASDVRAARRGYQRHVAALEVIVPAFLGFLEGQRRADDLRQLRRRRTRIEPQPELAKLRARAGQRPCTLEHVAQLAHVAGPRMAAKPLEVVAVDRA